MIINSRQCSLIQNGTKYTLTWDCHAHLVLDHVHGNLKPSLLWRQLVKISAIVMDAGSESRHHIHQDWFFLSLLRSQIVQALVYFWNDIWIGAKIDGPLYRFLYFDDGKWQGKRGHKVAPGKYLLFVAGIDEDLLYRGPPGWKFLDLALSGLCCLPRIRWSPTNPSPLRLPPMESSSHF